MLIWAAISPLNIVSTFSKIQNNFNYEYIFVYLGQGVKDSIWWYVI